MRLKSIQTKYILLVLGCILSSGLLVGGISIYNASQTAARETARNMNLTCESYRYKYDALLRDVQSSVEKSATYASNTLESLDRFSNDEDYRNAYANRLEDILSLEASPMGSVLSYYVRFSPDLLSFERGFRFTRSSEGAPFEEKKIVKIEDYQESDNEHVGWYYEPIEHGTTTWLEPYHNANLDTDMISCVTPFYKNGTLAGVIGMDIDLATLINDLNDLRIFDNGYAFLCSSAGEIYYHPLYDRGTLIQQDVVGFTAQLENESSGDVVYSGVSKGEEIDYAFRSLTNGMRLVLRAPVSEINAEVNDMTRTIVLTTLAILAASVAITIFICQRITRPLLDLTTAAAMISAGDYDIHLDVKSQDEVGTLAKTLQIAAVELKANAERMRQLAYKDPLTGVRNKTAYNLEVGALDAEIFHGVANFGVAVFDVNDLKTANDEFGHEQGDKVIRTGCRRICMAFPHSPVFRIGGDEFVAILRNEETSHVAERLAAFEERTKVENAAAEKPQDVVHVAVGVAFYDARIDASVQDVFNRADALMYESKQAMKQGKEVR